MNLAAKLANTYKLLKIDPNIILDEKKFIKNQFKENSFFISKDIADQLSNGLIYFNKADFIKINGWNECFKTVGYNDADFADRLIKVGLNPIILDERLTQPIASKDEEKVGTYKKLNTLNNKHPFQNNPMEL